LSNPNDSVLINFAPQLGRILIVAGLALATIGLLLYFARPLRLGALPGDLTFSGRGWQIAVPLGTSLLLSIVLTIVLNVLLRRR